MKPIGPLMIEHRLIERMIKLMHDKAVAIDEGGRPDVLFIGIAIDFIKSYADRCHHGKEEDILFRDLNKKQLSQEHKRILNELMEEHAFARTLVKSLLETTGRYVKGDESAVKDISYLMTKLSTFYPVHIAKEDKSFFLPCMDYFSAKEQVKMLEEFEEFDRMLIHEKYKNVVNNIEHNTTQG